MPPDPNATRMSFGDHLDELRRRVIAALLGVGVVVGVCLVYGIEIFNWLCEPLYGAQASLNLPIKVVGLGPTDAFAVYLKVSIISGLIVSAPWLLYQLWKFVVAGLYEHERRAVYILVPFSSVMVAAAVAFLYWAMLPICLTFFLTFAQHYGGDDGTDGRFEMIIQAKEYIRFVIYLSIGITIGFQLPVAMLVGGRAGILDAKWLSQYRGYSLLTCFIAGAVLTPTDPVSMFILAVPLYALFEFGLILIRIVAPKNQSGTESKSD